MHFWHLLGPFLLGHFNSKIGKVEIKEGRTWTVVVRMGFVSVPFSELLFT